MSNIIRLIFLIWIFVSNVVYCYLVCGFLSMFFIACVSIREC